MPGRASRARWSVIRVAARHIRILYEIDDEAATVYIINIAVIS